MTKQLQIRNSTAEFLIFQAEDKSEGVQVFYKDETIWASQKAIAALFDVDRSVITKHLRNIFETGELMQNSVCAKFAHTAEDGKIYNTSFYNLDAIIAVGYRVNSIRATQFRQWCTAILRQFAIRGYVIDKKHSVLDTAERMAKRHIPMTMEDWAKRIDIILEAGGDRILTDAGTVSHEDAQAFAETEFEKYRVIQDRLYESDFDLFTLPTLPTDEQEEIKIVEG